MSNVPSYERSVFLNCPFDDLRSEDRRVWKDWSSDVCSSDLLPHQSRQPAKFLMVTGEFDVQRTELREVGVPELPFRRFEIGRPACMERLEFRRVLFRSPAASKSPASQIFNGDWRI